MTIANDKGKKPAAKPTGARKPATTPPGRRSTKTQPDITKKSRKVSALAILGLVVLFAIIVVIGGVVAATHSRNESPHQGLSPAPNFASAIKADGHDPRFVQRDVGLGDLNRVIGTGLPGHTAKQFTNSVLRVSGHSAQALAIYASAAHLWTNPNDTSGLLTPDGTYLSQKGIMLWASLQGALTAKGVTNHVGNAPANWYNTGVTNGTFGRSATPGIYGNRTALLVIFPDGSKFVALRRCGNLAFPDKGRLPVVPTDNRLAKKIASQDPFAQGNAPIGGGQNQNPGPGTYTSTPDKPGPNPYTPPPSPSPMPTGSATPDPQPTPTPEATGTAGGVVIPPGG